MRDASPKTSKSQGVVPALIGASLTLAGCGGGLMAPEGPESNAFLDQISDNCGKFNIGSQPIDYLLSANSNDTYFMDETGKLSAGEVDKATYTNDINSFYPTGNNDRAIQCIFDQLEGPG
jgi:hypothetical protein